MKPAGQTAAQSAAMWAMFCMAVWMTGTIIVAVVATQNFFMVDRLIADSPSEGFHTAIQTLDSAETPGHPTSREMLRYLSAELNRIYFQYWNLAQLAVGILTLSLVTKIPGVDRAKWYIVGMLGIALFIMAALTPPIVRVGRSLDFVSRDSPPPAVVSELRTFGLLHVTYTVMTLMLLILGVLATLRLQNTRQTETSSDLDG